MTNLPVEMLYERIHLRFLRAPEAHWYHLADEDEVDLTKAKNIHDAFHPDDPTHTPTHILFQYKCSDGYTRWLCLPIDNDPEPTAEDLAEWQAASSGCGYYTFTGKPWLD